MSRVRAAALLCACALVANIVACAPAPPRRTDDKRNKGSENRAQEKTIVIRRVPSAYVYPFSLWPLPKYPARDDPAVEYIYNGKTFKKAKVMEQSKR